MTDTITCNGCGTDLDRVAPDGVELQNSDGYICEACQRAYDLRSGAVDAEQARVNADIQSLLAAREEYVEATLVEDDQT